jgi:exosortase A
MNLPYLSHIPEQWRRALPVLLLVLATVLVAYRDTAAAMVTVWSRSQTFAHAFLVPPIVLWLVWRQRSLLATLRPRPCAWTLWPIAFVAFAWLLGDLAEINSVTQFAMTALLVLAVPAVLGLQVVRAIMFPLGFLFFAVPFGEFLLPHLMNWTADFTTLALRLSGIPVYRDGMRIVIPTGTWSVVEACSGVRYLIASVMVGTLFAYLNYRSMRRRWIFVGIAVAVPIVANWVRAYLIVLISHLSDNKLAAGVDHLIYGWLFFGVVIGLMFAIGAWWSEPELPRRSKPAPAVPKNNRRQTRRSLATASVALTLMIAPQVALHALADVPYGVPPVLASPKFLNGRWQQSGRPISSWKPAFQNPSAELSITYTASGRDVGVYIGYYRQQDYERKLVSSTNELVKSTDPGWHTTGPAGSEALKVGNQLLTVRSTELRGSSLAGAPEQRLRVWQLYWVGDRLTANDYLAKIYAVGDRLLGRGDDAAVVVLYTDEREMGDARALLRSFAEANLTLLVDQLRETRNRTRESVAASRIANVHVERSPMNTCAIIDVGRFDHSATVARRLWC